MEKPFEVANVEKKTKKCKNKKASPPPLWFSESFFTLERSSHTEKPRSVKYADRFYVMSHELQKYGPRSLRDSILKVPHESSVLCLILERSNPFLTSIHVKPLTVIPNGQFRYFLLEEQG